MKPVYFPESNKQLIKPENMTDKECGSLSIYNDGKICISCWKLTWKDKLRVLFSGKVWVYVFSGTTQPPIALITENPFTNKKND